MNIFLDANILVAVLNKEYPLFSDVARVLSLADNKRFKVFTSPVCLAIAFYFAEKKSGSALAKKKISLLISSIEIASTDVEAVRKTVSNKSVLDFEDGLEYYSALGAGCKVIITENKEDFYFSEIEVLSSQEFLKRKF
ncbi:MAG: PIN domain-containing protein [Bacteroidales bacterium]|nr:PIN domain-containing protein [Bacteroidales bacterium]